MKMEQEWNKAVVTHYGANDRARLLMEECGELVQASNKILRYPDSDEARANLLEEMIDVSIMIEQIRTLFNYSDSEWNDMEKYKVNRCKKRFMEDVGTATDDAESEDKE
jgi:NTP pyrophosphatase (non-canonical NTP hydrolase)